MRFSFFSTDIYVEEDFSCLDNLNNLCDKYIEQAIKKNRKNIINGNDFGFTHSSISLTNDINFLEFIKFICKKSYLILDRQGYNLIDHSLLVVDLWVQEFSKNGGGHHNPHTHSNSHISGFYFLKCSEKTSYPIFHDPRPSKLMIQLPEKNKEVINDSSEQISFKPKPGTFIFFNSYLSHEYAIDHGKEPFRFIHFNIQAVPKKLIRGDIKKI